MENNKDGILLETGTNEIEIMEFTIDGKSYRNYPDGHEMSAKAFYHLFAYRCFNLIIDNRHFKQQLHGRSLQLRKYALLDDLFNNQGNRNDQIGLYRGESICYDFR